MPPRSILPGACRSFAIRTRPATVCREARNVQAVGRRCYAEEKEKPAKGPNQDVLGHVSEEASDMGKVTGETAPDLNQGTPVQEVLKRDQEGKDSAPEVAKEEMDKNTTKTSSMSLKERNQVALRHLEYIIKHGGNYWGPNQKPLRHEAPVVPLPPLSKMQNRYEPIVTQVTRLLMRHGKLGLAQRNMAFILNYLRTSPTPVPSPSRPLLPSAPPAHYLPLNPILYLSTAIDSVAPLVRIRQMRGAAGGGNALQLPMPLAIKQRRRIAVSWILDTINKRQSRGSGKKMFAHKFAEEIVAVVEGRSSVWEKRGGVHKVGTGARANVLVRKYRRY